MDRPVDGARVRDVCALKGMTHVELSRRSGVSYTHLKRILVGYQPSLRTALALAFTLGCDLDDILTPAVAVTGR